MTLKITIEGPPGAGKTSIARHIANECSILFGACHVRIFDEAASSYPEAEYGFRDNENKIDIFCIQTSE